MQVHGVVLRVAALALATGCAVPAEGTSPALLVIRSLEGRPGSGAEEGAFSQTFASDVLTGGAAVEDIGRVTFTLALRDPGTIELPSRPTALNAVTLQRYRVRYLRADGRGDPRIDVPYAFDGAMTMTVGPDEATGSLVLVRAQAKLEAPLVELRESQGLGVLSTIAEVTFYGRDLAGHLVAATGHVGINFADWPDGE
jgi:hypothetical protein